MQLVTTFTSLEDLERRFPGPRDPETNPVKWAAYLALVRGDGLPVRVLVESDLEVRTDCRAA